MRTIAMISAMTSKRWIRPPPTWKLNPRSQRMNRIIAIVYSICSFLEKTGNGD